MADGMQTPQSTTTRRAANWMVGLGILYGLVVVVQGGGAVFMYNESKHGGDWSGTAFVLGLLAVGVALWFLAVGVALLVLQKFVRQGRRGAITGANVVCWLAMLLPQVPVVLILVGNSPGLRQILISGLEVMIWVAPHLRIVWLLRKAKAEL